MSSVQPQQGAALKKAMPLILAIDLATIGGFLVLWFTTKNPVWSALPIALGAPIVAILFLRVAQIDKRAREAADQGPRIVE